MLMTGLYPMNNHTISNSTATRRDVPTIASVCKKSGYRTGYIGKWHLENNLDPFVPIDRRMGFEDFWASDNCRHRYFDSYYCQDSPEKIPLPGYQSEQQTRMAIKFIDKYKDQPFCLFMSWGPPHDPYKGPEENMAMFPPEKIELRQNVSERDIVDKLLKTHSSAVKDNLLKSRRNRRDTYDSDQKLKSNVIQGYYAMTQSLDTLMGKLLDASRAAGIEEDTILAFSSDHGDMLGSHRMGSKQMPFEEAISIPFILRYPPGIRAGTRTDVLLGPMDIMPTLLSMAGLDCPKVDGMDLSGAAKGQTIQQRDALLIMKLVKGGNPWIINGITPWRGVRTKQHTYARLNDHGPWVMFDNKKDPYQLNNLINKPEYADLQARLDKRTNELLTEANDPDDTDIIENFGKTIRREKPIAPVGSGQIL